MSTMRAAVVGHLASQDPVTVRDVPLPTPGPGWVLVRLHAAALNRLDAVMLEGRQDEAPGAIFGSDGAGVISALGPGVRAQDPTSVGSDVVISPSLFWGEDERFPSDAYQILGSPTHGTHAEYVVVPVENVVPRPPHLSPVQAAALPMAGVTAWRAVCTRGRLRSNETVVIGAASSGVGTFAVQIAASLGARVIAVTSSDAKAREALALGADATVDRTAPGFVDELRRATGGGADLALDPTGALWQPMVDALRPAGRLVVVGKMAATTGTLRVQSVYWKQVDVLGSAMGSHHDFRDLIDHVTRHGLTPVVDSVHALEDVAAAYRRLDSEDRVGKVVLSMPGAAATSDDLHTIDATRSQDGSAWGLARVSITAR